MNLNAPHLEWSIPGRLARASRPGYPADDVYPAEVDAWIVRAHSMGLKSIICLLTDEEISAYYSPHGVDLLSRYLEAGFTLARVPIADYGQPPVDPETLDSIVRLLPSLPAPWVIHCSAGVDRTGMVIKHLLEKADLVGRLQSSPPE